MKRKRTFGNSLSDKMVILILGLLVLTYFLFVTLPIIGIFLKIEPGQINAQLHNAAIIDAIQLSLFTSGTATLIAFVLTVPTAYFMTTRNFPGKSILDTLMDLPIVLPPAVAGIVLLYAFAPKGLLGPIFNSVGINYTRQHNSSYYC